MSGTAFRVPTAWGDAVLVGSGGDLVGVRPPALGAHRAEEPVASLQTAPAELRDLAEAMVAYFDGEAVELAEREAVERWLDAVGLGGARRDISLALFDVPRGVTLAYGELAAVAGYPGAARAAGSTCARNPLPIVIPCHRVVHAGARRGDVGSYGAATGPEYKRRLLQLEDAPLVRVAHSGS